MREGFRDRWMWRGAKGSPVDDAREDAFRRGCPRPTDCGLHPKAGSSASGAVFRPSSVVLRGAVGQGQGRLKSLSPKSLCPSGSSLVRGARLQVAVAHRPHVLHFGLCVDLRAGGQRQHGCATQYGPLRVGDAVYLFGLLWVGVNVAVGAACGRAGGAGRSWFARRTVGKSPARKAAFAGHCGAVL